MTAIADAPQWGPGGFARTLRSRIKGPTRGPVKMKVLDGVTIFIPGGILGRTAAGALQKALAVFLASAAARELTRRVQDFLPPQTGPVTDEELMRELEEWLRQQAAQTRSRSTSPRRPKKGLALPLLPRQQGERSQPGEGPRRQPVPGPKTDPVTVAPRPTRRKRDDEPEDFASWFERRFVRSRVRFQRLRERKRQNG